MADDVEDDQPPLATDAVRNSITGDPATALQLRDFHGGSVYINSQVFVAPEAGGQDRIGLANNASSRPSEPLRPLHILAVDDEAEVLNELVDLLRVDPRIGKVATASDAAMALRYMTRAVQSSEYLDALFLDVQMPGLSGMELARINSRFAKPLGIVFVTAFPAFALEAFAVDAVDYLVKPVQPDQVARAVGRLARAIHLLP
ncbi:hypothetical protein GCM10010174_35070 [Kutzneria viridogrisea]|uniref:CheY-like chemotaxis protein n=1 Tax=Kutzneria viridogrisea TaxID=47990 RepID=A0ABR6BLD1_9PSEU|nr:CheY-like chemotaxis protein [Kutzneria viridogrisea]